MPRGSYCRETLGQDPLEISRKRNRNLVMEVTDFVFNEITTEQECCRNVRISGKKRSATTAFEILNHKINSGETLVYMKVAEMLAILWGVVRVCFHAKVTSIYRRVI